jgi:hypothetical protein
MRMTASWFGSLDPPNTRLWRDRSAHERELPSDRHPDRTKRAVVLEAVKVWPGKGRVCGKADGRPTLTAPARAGFAILRVGAKKRDSKSNKETGMKEVENAVK